MFMVFIIIIVVDVVVDRGAEEMEKILENLVMVITGAGSGMGAATAELAAQYGARVVVSDLSLDLATATAERINAAGGSAAHFRCDVAVPSEIDGLIEFSVDTYGGIDVLHNNAGITDSGVTDKCSVEELSIDVWERIMHVNVRAPWLTTRAALPHLRKSSAPSVINVGSIGSSTAYPRCVAYGASKGGVAILTKSLALELAPDGIRVNAYGPGPVETDMLLTYFESSDEGKQLRDDLVATHLVPRMGLPEDIAELACFLASPKSSFVNGVLWLIDGGQLAWRGKRLLDADGN
jgi:NAD(P)-dependent dehydrogenase (short-subunit alcohol dehydrogenase family)